MHSPKFFMPNEEEVRKAEENLDAAEIRLVRAYFTDIEQKYTQLNTLQRRGVLTRLETLAKGMITLPVKESSLFDYKTAKETRQEAGLKLRSLAKQIGVNPGTLSRIENGRADVNMESTYGKSYLEFLKQNGYNPFGL